MEEFIRNTLINTPYIDYSIEDLKEHAFENQDSIPNFSVFIRNYQDDEKLDEKIIEFLENICKEPQFIKKKYYYGYYPHIQQSLRIQELEEKMKKNQEIIDNLTELVEDLQIKLDEVSKKKRFYFF
jgi:hypothetical protein